MKIERQKDHYIPETYLKSFIDETKPGHVRRYPKKYHGLCTPASPRSICWEWDGDRNERYFPDSPRILDKFLNLIECRWKKAIQDFEKQDFNLDAKMIIASNIARLRTCTPTFKRLGKTFLEADLENQKPLMINSINNPEIFSDFLKKNPQFDKGKDAERKMLIESLSSDDIRLTVEESFPHALAIQNVALLSFALYCQPWSIINNVSSKPFLTSDYPTPFIYYPNRPHMGDTYIPLTPRQAILIPTSVRSAAVQNKPFLEMYTADEIAVENLNTIIVKWAEDQIIANLEADWIKEMVRKYQYWRPESINTKVHEDVDAVFYQDKVDAIEKVKKHDHY